MPTPPLLEHPEPPRAAPASARLSATCPSSAIPARDTNPAPSAVTSTVTRRPSRITRKVKPQRSIFGRQQAKESGSLGMDVVTVMVSDARVVGEW